MSPSRAMRSLVVGLLLAGLVTASASAAERRALSSREQVVLAGRLWLRSFVGRPAPARTPGVQKLKDHVENPSNTPMVP